MPIELDGNLLPALFLSLPRLIGVSLFLPFTRAPAVPGPVRNAIMLTIALVVLPAGYDAHMSLTGNAHVSFMLLAAKEAAVGMTLGLLLGLAFLVPQMVGDYLDNQRGASIASLFNPALGGQSSPLGLLLTQAFIVVFIIAGGMETLFGLLLDSYRAYPISAPLPTPGPDAIDALLDLFSGILKLALLLSAPTAFTMLMAEMGLGLVSRFAPQLNVFFLAMPLKNVLALVIVGLSFGLIMDHVLTSEFLFGPLETLIHLVGEAPVEPA